MLLSVVSIHKQTSFGQESSAYTAIPLLKKQVASPAKNNPNLLVNRMQENSYRSWSDDSLMNILLPAVWKERDSVLGYSDKKQKASTTYYYSDALLSFAGKIRRRMDRNLPWKIIEDTVVATTSFPTMTELDFSPSANRYLRHYMDQQVREIFMQWHEKGKDDSLITKSFLLPLDSLKNLASKYGETYLSKPYAKQRLPRYAYERFLGNELFEHVTQNELLIARAIHKEFLVNFPTSKLLTSCNNKMAEIESELVKNAENPDLVFLKNSGEINSLKELLAPYNGKVVYLDIWGTWCGPCIEEMTRHTKPLKEHFRNRNDLVYLYLAMDEDTDNEKWKQFVLLNTVSGYHLRKNNTGIAPFWEELQKPEVSSQLYPTYVIFDRTGKIVAAPAKRPSDTTELYTKMEEILNQK